MSLEEIKLHLRVDNEDEDEYIRSLLSAAKGFMTNAGIKKLIDNELYNLAIKILISHWYENREVTGKANKLAYSLESIIAQLKYCDNEGM